MKIGDLVKEVTRMGRVPDIGLVIEVDKNAHPDAAMYLVQFTDGEDCWMAKQHLELINESC